MPQPHLGSELFDFLRDLRANNNRDWFQANKERYERDVKEPLLAFIAAFAEPLAEISPHIRVDLRPTGGSLFRIYRDVRFSKDKSPYKTHAAAQFRHKRCRGDVHTPGYYLHLEPGQVFAGSGIWRPDSGSLRKIREALVEHPERWTRAISLPEFRKSCQLSGDTLKRPPKGFDKDHPLIEDLKRKDFVASEQFDEAAATRADFLDRYVAFCRKSAPFMEFLAEALGLEW